MLDTIVHRGPDDQGIWVEGTAALGMRRLSIIDVAGGHQPMTNEDGRLWIVFNGEIYNYRELRTELEGRGHVFRTHADTETILHAYEEFGEDCVQHFRGMFAFVIWDRQEQRMFAARDRLGQKPFYYGEWGGRFWFGSEMGCLKVTPGFSTLLDLPSIADYLTLQYVPDPATGLASVKKLPPAHTLSGKPGQLVLKPYWEPEFVPKVQDAPAHRVEAVRAVLEEAVQLRMISEVPLGAHLSGGLDSSIIVGLMSRLSGQPVKTFSMGFEEAAFDESSHAETVARHFQTEHHSFRISPDAAALLPEMMNHFCEPFADPAALPTWLLAQETRKHVTVALNGDGGDEAFAGYQRLFADRYANILRCVPAPIRRAVADLFRRLPVNDAIPLERNRPAALQRLFEAAGLPASTSVIRWGSYFDEARKKSVLGSAFDERRPPPTWERLDVLFQSSRSGRVDRTLAVDLKTYLPGALLPKVDRMTMAHSVEARSPFLDHKVMETAARLPESDKLKGRQGKAILLKAFGDFLPASILQRSKQGFNLPIDRWFRGPLRGMAEETLLAPNRRTADILNLSSVRAMVDEHQAGHVSHGKRLWALLQLELWLRWL